MLSYNKDIKFQAGLPGNMAEEIFMFSVTAGIFAFLVAILFGSRARRYSQGYTSSEGHTEHG
jgi:hypothetical protein